MFSDDFINRNNAEILANTEIQPRYRPQETGAKPKPGKPSISDKEKEFLMAVKLYQYKKTLTEVYQSCGRPAGTLSRIAKQCEKKNLIKIIKLPFKRGCPRYPVLLHEAYKTLGLGNKSMLGKGAGYEHTLYQHLIAAHFDEFAPVIELNRADKSIDVGVFVQEKLICIEVARSATHESENIIKDFNLAKAELVVVACQSQKILKQVSEKVSGLPQSMQARTELCLIAALLNSEPHNFLSKHINE